MNPQKRGIPIGSVVVAPFPIFRPNLSITRTQSTFPKESRSLNTQLTDPLRGLLVFKTNLSQLYPIHQTPRKMGKVATDTVSKPLGRIALGCVELSQGACGRAHLWAHRFNTLIADHGAGYRGIALGTTHFA